MLGWKTAVTVAVLTWVLLHSAASRGVPAWQLEVLAFCPGTSLFFFIGCSWHEYRAIIKIIFHEVCILVLQFD